LAPKPIRKEAGTIGIPSIVVKAANPLRIKSVNGVFALAFTLHARLAVSTSLSQMWRQAESRRQRVTPLLDEALGLVDLWITKASVDPGQLATIIQGIEQIPVGFPPSIQQS